LSQAGQHACAGLVGIAEIDLGRYRIFIEVDVRIVNAGYHHTATYVNPACFGTSRG
jgi:hypothetical protein